MVRNPFKPKEEEQAKETPVVPQETEEVQYREVVITDELLNAKLNFIIAKLDLLLEIAQANK